MKIKFLTGVAGLDFSYAPGEIVDASQFPASDVTSFLNAGYAEAVKPEQQKATKQPSNKATKG
jgi:hypothetical protein